MGKMSISIYMNRDYEDFYAFERRKNKANSNPNKPNQSLTPTEQEGFREDVGRQAPATPPGRQTPVVSAWHLRVFEPLLTEQEGFREGIGRHAPATTPGRQTPVVSAWHLWVFEPLKTEQEGFEPPLPFGKTVFKTVALSRSATAPSYFAYFTSNRPALQENWRQA